MTTIVFAFNDTRQAEALLSRGKVNLLISYFYLVQKKTWKTLLDYIKSEKEKLPDPGIFMLDSGAYSAWNKGKVVNIWEFIKFIRENWQYFTHIVCLDVINNPVFSEVNHLLMLEALKDLPLTIIPVFHSGEPFSVLDYMIEKGYRYIGISPNNKWREEEKRSWLSKVYTKYDFDKLGIKTHGFGYQSLEGLARFPLTTSDAITWKIAAGYGRILDPEWPSVRYSDRAIGFSDHVDSVGGVHSKFTQELCKELGFSPDDLRNDTDKRAIFNMEAIDRLASGPKKNLSTQENLLGDDNYSGYSIPFDVSKIEENYKLAKEKGLEYIGVPF